MTDISTTHGILCLIDIVNFTGQSEKMGDQYTAQYTRYFQEKISAIASKHKFTVIKFLGDGALIFGRKPGNLLGIMLDLFDRDKPEDRYGFVSRFRMAAHSGYFQLQMKNRQPVDLVSAQGIKVFRLEKHAGPGELVVTPEFFQGLKALLTNNHIEAVRLTLDEPLKGFDSEDWVPLFYKLTYVGKVLGAANLLEQHLEELEQEVRFIRVFGNMYPPVPMEKNFINLSILCDWDGAADPEAELNKSFCGGPGGGFFKKSPLVKQQQDDWIFIERWEGKQRRDFLQIDVDMLHRDENKQFTNGVIFGMPGAGKTTILRHLAHKEFIANQQREPGQKKIILLVSCGDILFYDTWHKDRYGPGAVVPDVNTALEYLTWVFLFRGKAGGVVTPEQRVEFSNSVQKVKQAFKEERLTLLVDALDETPDNPSKERIIELILLLVSKNRLFLASRPSERVHLRQDKMPEFNVLSLTMDQVREVARQLMNQESPIYKKFDQAIWQEEFVTRMAATPITALLVTAYFQAYGQFDHRYPMYDLLMKFILIKVWEQIKTDAFPYKNLELFFREVKKQGFFEKYPDAAVMYEGLGSLCYRLFFEGSDGQVQHMVNSGTLTMHFREVIAGAFHYAEDKVAAFVDQWIERFQQDHLLIQAGVGEYVFIHSTIMEYLAAFHMVREAGRDNTKLSSLAAGALKKPEYLVLETVPIAAGNDLLKGFAILSAIRDLKVDYEPGMLQAMGVKCLAEVEWQITKIFQGLRIESLKKSTRDIIRQNRPAVDWVYDYLKTVVLSPEKDVVKESIEWFTAFTRLSQPTLLEQYLDYEAFDRGDSELVGLRKQLLENLVQKELVDRWLTEQEKVVRRRENVAEYENVLQLDTPGYHPEDKNFAYFQKLIGKELVGFLGSPNMRHLGPVRGCAFSPDSKYFASASDDGTLKLWNADNGREIRIFSGHRSAVYSCVFSPDGKYLVSASTDKTLKLWEVESGQEIHSFIGHQAVVWGCTFSLDGTQLVSTSTDQTIKLWEVESGREIRTFAGHMNSVNNCDFSPDGTHLASASSDQTLKLWDVSSGKTIRTFTGHQDVVWGCLFSPNGTHLVSTSEDKTLKLWDVESGKAIRTFTGHRAEVWDCDFSPDGTHLLSASADKTLKLWDVESVKVIRTFTGHQDSVYNCAFSPDGDLMVSVSGDQTLKLWKVESGKEICAFAGHKKAVASCVFSPAGTHLISASHDSTLKLWDVSGVASGKVIRTFTGHQDSVYNCAFSTDGDLMVSVSEDQTLKLWDVESGKEIRTFTGHQGAVLCCVFSPNRVHLVSGSEDNTLKLWEVESSKAIRTFEGHTFAVLSCAFSPDGTALVSASRDNTLKLWEVVSGKEIRTFIGHKDSVWGCAFSPAGTHLVSASDDQTLKLWEVKSGETIRTFIGHKGRVSSCAFSPDETYMASASLDKTVKLWKVENGQCLKTINLPWIPFHVDFSPTVPQRICTANENGTLTLFDFKEIPGVGK